MSSVCKYCETKRKLLRLWLVPNSVLRTEYFSVTLFGLNFSSQMVWIKSTPTKGYIHSKLSFKLIPFVNKFDLNNWTRIIWLKLSPTRGRSCSKSVSNLNPFYDLILFEQFDSVHLTQFRSHRKYHKVKYNWFYPSPLHLHDPNSYVR